MKFNYITADTHFGHTNINLYEPSRMSKAQMEGYDTFDEYMIITWNDTVGDNDEVLHLGDFAFKDNYKIAEKLKGKITLLVGNHDKKEHLIFYKKLGWKIIDKLILDIPKPHIIQNKLIKEFSKDELNDPLLACLVTDINNKRVIFSHFPVFDDNPYDKKYRKITKILEFIFNETKCKVNYHGHTHSKRAKEDFCLNVCLELNEFQLIYFEE